MNHAIIASALVLLFLSAAPGPGGSAETVVLKEARISIQLTSNTGEGALVVSAESETGLDGVEIRDPAGAAVARLGTARRGRSPGLFGFEVEVGEAPQGLFLATWPAGEYQLRARAPDGRLAVGTARLSHRLLPTPAVLAPRDGDVVLAASSLQIDWVPDPQAVEYRIQLEQGETDLMSARLAGSTSSFRVPDGILAAGRRYLLEVGAVGVDGNCTLVEIPFLAQ